MKTLFLIALTLLAALAVQLWVKNRAQEEEIDELLRARADRPPASESDASPHPVAPSRDTSITGGETPIEPDPPLEVTSEADESVPGPFSVRVPGAYIGLDSLPPDLRETAIEKLGNPAAAEAAVSFVFSDLAFSAAFVDPPLNDVESVALAARWQLAESNLSDMLEHHIQRLDRESDFIEFESRHDAETFRDGEPEREVYIRARDGRYRAYDITDLKRSARYAQEEQLLQEHSRELRAAGRTLRNLRYAM